MTDIYAAPARQIRRRMKLYKFERDPQFLNRLRFAKVALRLKSRRHPVRYDDKVLYVRLFTRLH